MKVDYMYTPSYQYNGTLYPLSGCPTLEDAKQALIDELETEDFKDFDGDMEEVKDAVENMDFNEDVDCDPFMFFIQRKKLIIASDDEDDEDDEDEDDGDSEDEE